MTIRYGPNVPRDHIDTILWTVPETIRHRQYDSRRHHVSKGVRFLSEEIKPNILKDAELLPNGIYPLFGVCDDKFIFYNYGLRSGLAIPTDDLDRYQVPRFLVKEAGSSPAKRSNIW